MAEAVIKKIKKSKLTENGMFNLLKQLSSYYFLFYFTFLDRQSLKHALIKEFDSLRDEIAKMF